MTQNVLASEIYGMINGFDLRFIIKQTLGTIYKRINLAKIPFVLYIDSYLLYQCFVQLGTTSKKRLMIDIMALRESYEGNEINEIRWIFGKDNPADAMTKASSYSALKKIITTNKSTIRLEVWVKQ